MEEKAGEKGSAFLFELRGRDPGSLRSLEEQIFRIGSDVDNHLRLDDSGVALFQAEIHFSQGQYYIRNLSLEGDAFLNGSSFEETSLHKGDIITVGNSMFRFVEHGETLTQEELWRPVGGKESALGTGKGWLRRVSFLAVLVLFAIGVVVAVMLSQRDLHEEIVWKDGAKPPTIKRSVDRKELLSHYDRGKALMVARRWDEAIVQFDMIRNEMPNYKDTENLYRRAMLQTHYLDLLNQSKGLYIEGELAQAKRDLQSLPEESVYFREAERLIRDVDDKILELRLAEAEQYLAKKDWVAARREAEAILAKYPNNKRAHDILKSAKSLQRMSADSRLSKTWFDDEWNTNRIAKPDEFVMSRSGSGGNAAVALPSEGTRAPALSGNDSVSPSPAPVRSTRKARVPQSPMEQAVTAYVKGDAAQSLSLLEPIAQSSEGADGERSEKAAKMMDDLRAAESLFHQARVLQDEGRYSEALELWERFFTIDREISGKLTSDSFKQASVFLSKIYYQRGQQSFEQDDLPDAFFYWNMAKQIHPKNKDVQAGLKELAKSARSIYRDGYALQDISPDEAMSKWEVVLKIVPPSNPYFKKAKEQLKRLASER